MAMRNDVTYSSGRDRISAWWYPAGRSNKFTTIVMAHGFGGTREMRLDAYAERFQTAGFAVLVFDYCHFGASGGTPRQVVDIEAQLHDWRASIAYARSLPGVDKSRIVLWGTSFSGGHVVALAAEDSSIAAIIAQTAFTDGPGALKAAGAAAALRLSGAGLKDIRHSGNPYYVPIAARPGELGALTSPDAEAGVRSLIPAGADFDNRVAARVFFHLPRYRPGKLASKVKCPALFQIAERDAITSPASAKKAAKAAARGRIETFPIGHFDIYTGSWFEKAVESQIAFLKSELPS